MCMLALVNGATEQSGQALLESANYPETTLTKGNPWNTRPSLAWAVQVVTRSSS